MIIMSLPIIRQWRILSISLQTVIKRIAAALIQGLEKLLPVPRAVKYGKRQADFFGTKSTHRYQPKPDWVVKEVIRLKAHLPDGSGYTIAHVFNRLHQKRRNMTVSKSYVYTVFKKHSSAIIIARKKIKRRKPYSYRKNQLWQLDLTEIKTDEQSQLAFGVIDSGTRACLSLNNVPNKMSITLIRTLLDTIEKYGKSQVIRTDNEPVFVSYLFKLSWLILGVKRQTTQLASPWQNGRIERLFGTLKIVTSQILIPEQNTQRALRQFRCWYNHVRPHQNLGGLTPSEAWSNKAPNRKGKSIYVNEWDSVLTGFYIPPG